MTTIKKTALAALALAGSALLPHNAEAQTRNEPIPIHAYHQDARDNTKHYYQPTNIFRRPVTNHADLKVRGNDLNRGDFFRINSYGRPANFRASTDPMLVETTADQSILTYDEICRRYAQAKAANPRTTVATFEGRAVRDGHTQDFTLYVENPRCAAPAATRTTAPRTTASQRTQPPAPNADSIARANAAQARADSIAKVYSDSVNAATAARAKYVSDSTNAENARKRARDKFVEDSTKKAQRDSVANIPSTRFTIGAGYLAQISESDVPRGLYTMTLNGPVARVNFIHNPGKEGALVAIHGFGTNASGTHGEQGGARDRTAITTYHTNAEALIAHQFANNLVLGARGAFTGTQTSELADSANTTVQGRRRVWNAQVDAQIAGGYSRNGLLATGAMGLRVRDDAQPGTNPQTIFTAEVAREGVGSLEGRLKFEHVQNGDATVTSGSGSVNYLFKAGWGVAGGITFSNQKTLAESTQTGIYTIALTKSFGGKYNR